MAELNGASGDQPLSQDIAAIEVSERLAVSVFYVLFISAVAAIGGFLFGFDSGVITNSPK